MTALKKFVRLEAPALWQSDRDAQRRDVVVSFGDATLIIIDQNEVAQAHWSLAALERLNPGAFPAVFAPGSDTPERLEISDPDMIAAIEKVRKAIAGGGAHPGRLRRSIYWGIAVAIALGVIFWLPPALAAYTARIVPDATRDAIGRDLARELTRLAGQPCQSPAGTRALRLMSGRLFPGEPVTLAVYPAGISTTLPLPGGIILIGRQLVEDHDAPKVPAGFVLAAKIESTNSDPVRDMLDFAGPLASVRLMTSGVAPPSALSGYAEHLLKVQTPSAPDDSELSGAMMTAGVPIAPYAQARTAAGVDASELLGLGETPADAVRPILSDTNWTALMQICAR